MKGKYRKYKEGGPIKPKKKRKSPLDKFFETAPKGTKIEELENIDGMDVFTMSDGSKITQRHSQTSHFPYDAGAIEKAYNDKTQYENAMKAFNDSLSLANFSTDGLFPLYDDNWDKPYSLAGIDSSNPEEVIKRKSELAREIVNKSKGDIKGYYPGDTPGYWMYGSEPLLRWSDDPNKKLDGKYRGGDTGYYGYESDHNPYKRTDFDTGSTLMYNEKTKDFTIPVDVYESKSVPMGQGNYVRKTYMNDRGDEQTLLKDSIGGDWLKTDRIIQTANESGSNFIDQGYHRVEYPDFPPPKIRPVYREPVSKVSLPPKTARLPMPKVNFPYRDPLPKFYGRDMNRNGDIIYDTSFGQFVTTKDKNRLSLLKSNQAGSRYKNNMNLPPMLDQDFQNMFRARIDEGVRKKRGNYNENQSIIKSSKKSGRL